MKAERDREGRDPQQPLPPLATGIALGLWIAVMLFLGFVVVPTAFGSCTGPSEDPALPVRASQLMIERSEHLPKADAGPGGVPPP